LLLRVVFVINVHAIFLGDPGLRQRLQYDLGQRQRVRAGQCEATGWLFVDRARRGTCWWHSAAAPGLGPRGYVLQAAYAAMNLGGIRRGQPLRQRGRAVI